MNKLHLLSCICITATLLLQAMPASANKTPSAAAEKLLIELRTCLDQVDATMDVNFTSPCAYMKVTALKGIRLKMMREALGSLGVCGANASYYQCKWGFYKLQDDDFGGGPELQCYSEDRTICKQVRWINAE
jgi:hypothetical protein